MKKGEYLIALLLKELAQNGVERTEIDFSKLAASKDETADELFENSSLLSEAAIWLQNEGVIRGESFPDGFYGCLTSYGFCCFGGRMLEQDQTLGQAVTKVSAGEAQYVKLGGLLGGILGGFTKSIS